MPLTPEQAESLKKQIFEQINSQDIPNKEEIIQQIKDMDEPQLENFLKQQQKLVDQQKAGQLSTEKPEKPIFAQIVAGEIPSFKIAENAKSIAILELNPLSEGHSIILPKQKVSAEKIPKSALSLAQKVAQKIKKKLSPEDIKIETSSFQNYPMINIIPIYKNKKLEKKKAEESDLKKLQSKLETKKRSKRISEKTIKPSVKNLPEIGFRIP